MTPRGPVSSRRLLQGRLASSDPYIRKLARADQIALLYSQLPLSTAGMLVAGTVMLLALGERVSLYAGLSWLGAILALQSARLWLYWQFLRTADVLEETDLWAKRWTWGALLSGIIWGASVVWIWVPDSFRHQAFIALGLLAVTTGALMLVAVYTPAFLAFVIPTLVPLIVRLGWEGDTLHRFSAVACFIVLVVMLVFGRRLQWLVVTALTQLREVENAMDAKEHFFRAAQHDLSTPLRALKIQADGIVEREQNPAVLELAKRAASCVALIQSDLDQMLRIAEIDAGKRRLLFRPVPVQKVFDAVEAMFGESARHKGLELRFARSPATLHADREILELLLRNLVSNAIRYTNAGRVAVRCRSFGAGYRIVVRDTGIGIARSEREKIFRPFYQVRDVERGAVKGMGLGLALVERLANLVNYSLRVVSVPGKGSLFRVTIPGGVAALELPGSEESHGVAGDASPGDAGGGISVAFGTDFGGRLAVVIDDDPTALAEISGLLESWNCSVVAARSTRDAQDLLEEYDRPPGLLVVDYRLLDGENGLDAIAALRARAGAQVPALLVTSSGEADLPQKAADAGIQFLPKPIRRAGFRTLVTHLLNPPRLPQE